MLIGQRRAIAFEETVKLPYIDQDLNLLVLDKTVREEISSGHDVFQLGNAGVNSRGFCSASPSAVANSRSGQACFCAANGTGCAWRNGSTNYFDVETLRALESTIEELTCYAIIITRDRFTLDRCRTRILAFYGTVQIE